MLKDFYEKQRLDEAIFIQISVTQENIKKKLLEIKQDGSTLPEGEYEEFKADMFDDLELPFTLNLLISDRDEVPIVSRNTMNTETTILNESKSTKSQ
uniref:Uncharacterized protein n=1 Tax=Onchocerca volvulus TaxID=6282 RepID=A0A8R1Y313_ONCVO